MNKKDFINYIIAIASVSLSLFITLFNNETLIKTLFIILTGLILLLLKSYEAISKSIYWILTFFICCLCIITVYSGSLSQNNVNERGDYTLNLLDAINSAQTSGNEDYKKMDDKSFIVKEGKLINTETYVEYSYDYQAGQNLIFNNMPSGTYYYQISFQDIDYVYTSNPIELFSNTMVSNDDMDDYTYEYIKINEEKAKYSDWGNWSEYSTEKVVPNSLTNVRVKIDNVEKVPDRIVKSLEYDTSRPIYDTKKVEVGTETDIYGNEIPIYAEVTIIIGYETIEKRTPIYLYNNARILYSYQTRTVENYSEAVEEYFAKYDENDYLLDAGYIKLGRVISKKTIQI